MRRMLDRKKDSTWIKKLPWKPFYFSCLKFNMRFLCRLAVSMQRFYASNIQFTFLLYFKLIFRVMNFNNWFQCAWIIKSKNYYSLHLLKTRRADGANKKINRCRRSFNFWSNLYHNQNSLPLVDVKNYE